MIFYFAGRTILLGNSRDLLRSIPKSNIAKGFFRNRSKLLALLKK